MLNGIPEETTPTLLVRPGSDALRISFINRKPTNPVLPPIALEILKAAVAENSPINYVTYDGGMALQVGGTNFDCKFNLEVKANLEHAVTMLVQVGWIKQTDEGQYHVTHAGYEAARKIQGEPNGGFLEIKKQMPELIAEMKKDFMGEDGEFVREFFVMSKRHILGGTEKNRFVYYEEDHDNLHGKIDILENRRYIVDVTPGNTPIYRMSEEFVKLVLADT
jgi:hypothetical protein